MIFNLEGKAGGGSPVIVNKRRSLLNFYDYEGTLVDSYGANEIQNLTALPSAPDHSIDEIPLTFQEWNWTLAQIKTFNTSYPTEVINVGATYVTADGKTHFIVKTSISVKSTYISASFGGSGTIDWGDGTTDSYNNERVGAVHTYTDSLHKYHCIITGASTVGSNSSDATIVAMFIGADVSLYRTTGLDSMVALEMLTIPKMSISVNSGSSINISQLQSLRAIVIPNGISYINSLQVMESLQCFCIPYDFDCFNLFGLRCADSITSDSYPTNGSGDTYFYNLESAVIVSSGKYTSFNSAFNLRRLVMKKEITNARASLANSCYNLREVELPNTVTVIYSNAFKDCRNLKSIDLPAQLTTIADNAFSGCRSLPYIEIPATVTSIGNNAFENCGTMNAVFMKGTTPPTLGTSVFSTSNQKHIYVPASAVSTYKSATNWSSYSSIISANPYE